MSLREEVELYSKITGKDGTQEPIIRIGAYLDGYEKGKEDAEPHWIPVTERLPEESGLYQVTDMQGNVVRYVFNANEGSEEYWRRCVKAWMPLPEPFKGVTE